MNIRYLLLGNQSLRKGSKNSTNTKLIEMECEEESRRRLKQQKKITEEAEQKRLAAELAERKQALLEEAKKCSSKKKGSKKPIFEGEKVTKQSLTEKKLQKLAKTVDYLERAKREEATPLIEAAFQ